MPRPRKYDYKTNYPVRLFINVRVDLMNELEEIGLDQKEIQELLSKNAEKYLLEYVEKNRKKG
jgi:hypothetical protein